MRESNSTIVLIIFLDHNIDAEPFQFQRFLHYYLTPLMDFASQSRVEMYTYLIIQSLGRKLSLEAQNECRLELVTNLDSLGNW
jgi:hypothetical protein